MEYEIKAVLRAILSGLRETGKLDDAGCEAILRALATASRRAIDDSNRTAAERIALLAAEIGRDLFGAGHSIEPYFRGRPQP